MSKSYDFLLKEVKDPDVLSSLNIRYQYNELIPLLSEACLELIPDKWSDGFYEKLKTAVSSKKEGANEDEETEENEEKGKGGDEGNRRG